MQTIAPLWLWATFIGIVLTSNVFAVLALTILLSVRSATADPKR